MIPYTRSLKYDSKDVGYRQDATARPVAAETRGVPMQISAEHRVPGLIDDTTDGSMMTTSEAKQSCLAPEDPEICACHSQGVSGLAF